MGNQFGCICTEYFDSCTNRTDFAAFLSFLFNDGFEPQEMPSHPYTVFLREASLVCYHAISNEQLDIPPLCRPEHQICCDPWSITADHSSMMEFCRHERARANTDPTDMSIRGGAAYPTTRTRTTGTDSNNTLSRPHTPCILRYSQFRVNGRQPRRQGCGVTCSSARLWYIA